MPQRKIEVVISGRMEADTAFRALMGDLGQVEEKASRTSSALSKLGQLGLAGMGVSTIAQSVRGLADAFGLGLNVEMENVAAQFNAFTKDGEKTAEILDMINKEAATTPFQFQEMSKAAAGLMSSAKQAEVPLLDLIRDAEILAASNPAEGLEGAAFALREAVSGDFTSIIERFNLPRTYINKLKDEGVPALEIVRRTMKEVGYDMDLVSNLSKTASGRWSTLMDTFDNLKRKLSEPMFNVLSAGLAQFQTFLDDNMATFQAWAENIGNAMGFIGRQLSAFLATGDIRLIADNFQEAFGTDIPTVLSAFAETLWSQLTEWGRAFVEWVAPIIPPLLEELGQLAADVLGWLLGTGLPMLAGQLATWTRAFIDWAIEAVPPLMTELGKLLSSILDWLAAEGPGIAKTFIREWAPAALAWVGQAAIDVVPKLAELLWAIIDWTVTEGIPKLATAFYEIGREIVLGLWDGIAGLGGWLSQQVGNFFYENTVGRAKAILGIESPSKEFYAIGLEIGAGLAGGIRDSQSEVEAAIRDMASVVTEGGTAVWDAIRGIASGDLGTGGMAGGTAGYTGLLKEVYGRWVPDTNPHRYEGGQVYFQNGAGEWQIDTAPHRNMRGNIEGYQFGGVVPGPVGMPQLAVVHGGETVVPAGKGGVIVNINNPVFLTADRTAARQLARLVKPELDALVTW